MDKTTPTTSNVQSPHLSMRIVHPEVGLNDHVEKVEVLDGNGVRLLTIARSVELAPTDEEKAVGMTRGFHRRTAKEAKEWAALIVKAVNSYDANQAALKALVEAAKLGLEEAEETLRQVGGCDHTVNYCSCSIIRAIEALKGALALAQEVGK